MKTNVTTEYGGVTLTRCEGRWVRGRGGSGNWFDSLREAKDRIEWELECDGFPAVEQRRRDRLHAEEEAE